MLRSREFHNVLIKDEGLNPTGSFKAQDLCRRDYGATFWVNQTGDPIGRKCCRSSSCLCGCCHIEANIFMPKDVPIANRIESEMFGANVTLVNGLISDAQNRRGEEKKEHWFNVPHWKEPYRVEGKKTIGYEVTEQLDSRFQRAFFIQPAVV